MFLIIGSHFVRAFGVKSCITLFSSSDIWTYFEYQGLQISLCHAKQSEELIFNISSPKLFNIWQYPALSAVHTSENTSSLQVGATLLSEVLMPEVDSTEFMAWTHPRKCREDIVTVKFLFDRFHLSYFPFFNTWKCQIVQKAETEF